MSSVSHADVIGIVLFLLLGAVSYYFYARMTQMERKVGLMENILFDLKITTEQTLNQLTDTELLPVSTQERNSPSERFVSSFRSVESDDEQQDSEADEVLPVSQNSADTKELTIESPSSRARGSGQQSVQVERESRSSVSVNYEAMTYKELQALAKQRGISGLRNVSKAQVIDALKARDGSSGKRSMEIPDIQTWMQDATPLDQQDDKIGGMSVGGGEGAGTLLEDETDTKTLEVDASLVAETL